MKADRKVSPYELNMSRRRVINYIFVYFVRMFVCFVVDPLKLNDINFDIIYSGNVAKMCTL